MILAYLNFDYSEYFSDEDIKNKYSNSLERYKKIPGLLRKYYTINSEKKIAGGVYLFDSMKAAKALLESNSFERRIQKIFGTKKKMYLRYETVQYIVDNINDELIEL
tara:strand:- start:129 stop:449 length:321 start_codon:yes stop_codon:yes gene_type:complete